MSCRLTVEPVRKRSKLCTRRIGWKFVKVGDLLNLLDRSHRGLPKGATVENLALVRVVNVRWEALNAMTANQRYGRAECIKEGFPDLTPRQFVNMFCKNMKCEADQPVTRIEWEYVEENDLSE